MTRVGVIGGGTAGTEAAREASDRGAEVTLIDSRDDPDQPWGSWPDLVRPGTGPRPYSMRTPPSSANRLVDSVLSVKTGTVATSRGRRIEFDFIVTCTGCHFVPPTFRGSRKPGVHILDAPGSHASLADESSSAENAALAGEGYRALAVADRLHRRTGKLRLLVSRWGREKPSPPVLSLIGRAAEDVGVTLSEGAVGAAIGLDRVEAVEFEGGVVSCDLLGFLPDRVPSTVPLDVMTGPAGAIPVDGSLRTAAPGTFAAGGCAEPRSGLRCTFGDHPGITGRVAGANSAGDRITVGALPSISTSAFGLRFCRIGLGAKESRFLGFNSRSVSNSWESSTCTIVFESGTTRVLGVDFAEPEGAAVSSLPLYLGPSLRYLAYGLGSSDISLLSDTARLGLKIAEGSSLRPHRGGEAFPWSWGPGRVQTYDNQG